MVIVIEPFIEDLVWRLGALCQEAAHLLLQMRTQVLDERLEETFRGWYPDFRPAENEAQEAA
jgi:hypothetical protein